MSGVDAESKRASHGLAVAPGSSAQWPRQSHHWSSDRRLEGEAETETGRQLLSSSWRAQAGHGACLCLADSADQVRASPRWRSCSDTLHPRRGISLRSSGSVIVGGTCRQQVAPV
jgi:hypothetical protein